MQEEVKQTPTSPEASPEKPTPPPAPVSDQKDIEENKIFAVLAYIGILVLVPLLAKKESKFAIYHAKQGLVLFIGEVIIMIFGWILAFIPFVGWLIGFILWMFLVVLSIMGIINAAQGQYKEVPILGKYGAKFKF